MHKLIYISYIMEDITPGYKEKIRAQVKAFNNLGLKAYLYTSTTKGACLYEVTNNEFEKVYFKKYTIDLNNPIHKIVNKLIRKRFIDFCLGIKEINDLIKPDVMYIRRIIPITNLLLSIIKKYKKNKVIVLYEYPTYPWKKEMSHVKGKLKLLYLMDCLNYNRLIKLVDIVPAILGEKINLPNKFIEITNGIATESIKNKSNSKSTENTLNLIGVAHIAYWHGYDRLIEGLKNYYNEKNDIKIPIYFHIVGEGPELNNLKQLVIDYNLSEYVSFNGIKTGQELDNLFDLCDIGVGSLANHRKGLIQDSALKNREYCARGIPFIIASKDDAFKDNFKYILKIKPDESSVDIRKIIKFYDSIKCEDNINEMRKYAEENLNWDSIMKPVVYEIEKRFN